MSAIEELGRYYGADGVDAASSDGHPLAERDGTRTSEAQASTSAPDGAPDAAADAVEDDGYIRHSVQKADTLAGLAVQYNVAVSDIKRANGLMSESMMWCRSKLLIPRRPLPLSDEQQRQVAQLVAGAEPIESTRSRLHRQWREGDQDKKAAVAALDNLNSYYELGDTTEPGQWGASTRLARNGAAGGEVEMGTLPAGEESVAGGGYGDDRVRLRGRRDQSGEPEWRPEAPAASHSEVPSINPFSACLPQQPLLTAQGGKGPGLIRKYFGDIMEKPSGGEKASGSPAAMHSTRGPGPPRPGSTSSSGPPSSAGAPPGRGGGGVSSLLSRLTAAAGKPAFSSSGPSLSAIGDGLLSRGAPVQQGPSAAQMRRQGSAVSLAAAAKGGKGE